LRRLPPHKDGIGDDLFLVGIEGHDVFKGVGVQFGAGLGFLLNDPISPSVLHCPDGYGGFLTVAKAYFNVPLNPGGTSP
jgi:hypothetical protein